jgi:2-oxo-3-hexenedioate decarboxylase
MSNSTANGLIQSSLSESAQKVRYAQDRALSIEPLTSTYPEIVFKLSSVPAVNASPHELLSCIDWMAHGFEIVQSNFKDWKFKVQDTIAQGGLHGLLLIGPQVKVASATNQLITQLEQFTLELQCDKTSIDV